MTKMILTFAIPAGFALHYDLVAGFDSLATLVFYHTLLWAWTTEDLV